MKFLAGLLLLAPSLFAQTHATFVGPDQVSREYTLKSHPRVWLDGPDGTISSRLKDPDGAGPLRNANYDRVPAQGLISRVNTTRSGCLSGGVIKNCRGVYEMASDAAFLWWMCNQCTVPWSGSVTWLDFSKDLYLNLYSYGFKRWHGSHKFGDALAPDAGDDPSGMTDFGGPYGAITAAGYSIIRDQLTPSERSTVARYFLNGLLPEDYCTYPSVRQPLKISKASNTTITLTSGEWPAEVAVGEWIDIKAYKDANGNVLATNQAPNGYWSFSGIVQAKTATTITLKIGSGGSWLPNFQEGYFFTYSSFQQNTCGMMNVFLMHSDTPRYTEPPSTQRTRTLAADVPADAWDVSNTSGVTRVITIADSSPWNIEGFPAPSPSTPWKAVLGGGDWEAELVLIEGVDGANVTIRRGLYHHSERTHLRCASWDPACSSPRGISVLSKVNFGTRDYNTGLNNRELTRAQSVLAIGLAFADDDPRAVKVLERSAGYFGTDSHKWAERFFTLTNYSIASYQYGRGVYYARMAMFLKNSIASPAVDYYDTGNNLTDQYLVYPYWARPWAMKEVVEPGLDGNWYSCYWTLNAQRDCGQLAFMAQLTHPGSDAAKYAWSFLTSDNGYTLGNSASEWAGTDYYGEGMIGWLAMLAGYPNDIQSAANKTNLPTTYARTHGDSQFPGGNGYKIGVSRTDWSSTATYMFRIAHDAFSDKLTGEGTLNSYGIGKNGWLVYSPGFRQRFQNNFHNNQIDFGTFTKAPYYLACTPTKARASAEGLCVHHNYPTYSTKRDNFLWMNTSQIGLHKGGESSTFTDLHGLIRNWRQIAHIKGGKDFIIVMDDIAKTVNEKFRVRTMYPQNGETVTMANGNRSYTEGLTSIAGDFNSVESRTGGQEGPESKIITRWLFTDGAAVNAVYDLPVMHTGSTSTSEVYTVCADATPSQPCRVKIGASERTFTEPIGTLTFNPADDADLKEIYLTFDPVAGTVNVRWNAGIPTTPVCGGSVQCLGEASELPSNELVLLRYKWSFSGAPYDGCLKDQTLRTGSPPFHVGTCNQVAGPTSGFSVGKFDNARAVMVEAAPTTTGVVWMWHRATSDLNEVGESGTAFGVSGDGANHRGLLIGGTEPVLAVLPVDNARARTVEFTATNSSPARLLVAGLIEGTYRVLRDGTPVATDLVVGQGEAALFVSGIDAGTIRVENLTKQPVRAYNPQGGLQGLKGQPFEFTLQAIGGVPTYQWTCCGAGGLPDGLTLSGNGLITGTPQSAGLFTPEFTVLDSDDPAGTATVAIPIQIVDPNAPVNVPQPLRIDTAMVSDRTVVLEYGNVGLSEAQSCAVRLTSDAQGAQTLATATDSGGKAIRRASFSSNQIALPPDTTMYANVDCGGAMHSVAVTTLPLQTGGNTAVSLESLPPAGAQNLRVEYGLTELLGQEANATCGSLCEATLSAPPEAVIFVRLTYRTSGGQVVATSTVFPVQAQ